MWSVEELQDQPVIRALATFDDFYRREFPAVVGLAYALSGNRWVAEDLAQESFLVAHREWERVGAYEDPGAWVRRVVTNFAVSAFRRRVIEAKALARLALGQVWVLPDLEPPDERFWRAVRSLPRRQSQVVTLHYLEDRPVSEIADILGMAPGTVKKHLYDGRQTLARLLETEEDQP
jgi:RNA polymerase sigma-70 factor (ECF subfamily)